MHQHHDPRTVTQRESEPRRTVHVVPPLEEAFNAGLRAPARGSVTAKTNTEANRQTNPGSPTHSDRLAVLRRWATPPNPKTVPAPSWEDIKRDADLGRQVPPTGWPHTLSVLWSRGVALPGRAVVVWLDWVLRSPSRFLAAFVVYALVAHLPGMGWLPWFF